MKAEEPYVGKPLVRFREGRGGNWGTPAGSTPSTRPRSPETDKIMYAAQRGQAHLPNL